MRLPKSLKRSTSTLTSTMKAIRIVLLLVVSLILIGGVSYIYASSGVKSQQGYIDLPAAPTGLADALVAVNLGPGGVKPLRWLIEQWVLQEEVLDGSDQILIDVLQELHGVQLRIYQVHDNQPVFVQAIDASVAALQQKDWHTLIKVRDGDEHLVVMQYGDDRQISGLSLLATIPENAVFLNLIGPFDAQAIAQKVKAVR